MRSSALRSALALLLLLLPACLATTGPYSCPDTFQVMHKCGENGAAGFRFSDNCRTCECQEQRREEPAGGGLLRVTIQRGVSCEVTLCRTANNWNERLTCQRLWSRVLSNFRNYVVNRRNRLE